MFGRTVTDSMLQGQRCSSKPALTFSRRSNHQSLACMHKAGDFLLTCVSQQLPTTRGSMVVSGKH